MAVMWVIVAIAINTPAAAIDIASVPDAPAFPSEKGCYDYINEKDLKLAACVWTDVGGDRSPKDDSKLKANLYFKMGWPGTAQNFRISSVP